MKRVNRLTLLCLILSSIGFTFACPSHQSGYRCPLRPAIGLEGALLPFTFDTTALGVPDLVVMTRNLYLGADVQQIATVLDLASIYWTTERLFEDMVKNEFPRRAEEIAREIEQFDPDIISLQETVLIRSGRPDYLPKRENDAECVEYDYLEIIREALANRGLAYNVAVTAENADIESPDIRMDVRLTDRDVILVRSSLATADASSAAYERDFTFPIPFLSITVKRSYSEVLVSKEGRTVRFINTHLEVPQGNDASVQEAQARELDAHIDEVMADGIPVILAGDLNSGPSSTGVPRGVYDYLRTTGGMTDVWDRLGVGDGYTCCYAPDLTGDPAEHDQRIDHIMFRETESAAIIPTGTVTTETDERERIVTTRGARIWASDHGGVVAGFSFAE